MMRVLSITGIVIGFLFGSAGEIPSGHSPYPLDGYAWTGIRRLEYVRLVAEGKLPGTKPPPGAMKSVNDITLHLTDDAPLWPLPEPDAGLQQRISALFSGRDPSYSLALLDITPGKARRLALVRADNLYQPGSVGKLAVAAGLFAELRSLFPDDPEARRALLRTRMVTAGPWIHTDSHTIPIFDPETLHYQSRPAQESDVFTLYEWADHMLSASSNAAASVVWKEVILMRAFGSNYPPSPAEEQAFFRETPKEKLRTLSLSVVNDPLRAAGINQKDWQLGSLFTNVGQQRIPGASSYGNPRGLLTFLTRLEEGQIVDAWSSLEIKRLLYMTARRIRYASAPALTTAAVYFKSGSLYKCKMEEGFSCGKYMGNVDNYMNSIAIVETKDGQVYLVALMSNVLRKNSAVEHQSLATFINAIVAE